MARESYETKDKGSVYFSWIVKRFLGLIVLTVVFFGLVHLMARADFSFASEIDVIGKLIFKTGDPGPQAGEGS
jgi:hypothetical protein